MGKLQLQKHERAVIALLEENGYTVEVVGSTAKSHRKIRVRQDCMTCVVTVSSSPTNKTFVAREVLRTVQQRMQKRNTA